MVVGGRLLYYRNLQRKTFKNETIKKKVHENLHPPFFFVVLTPLNTILAQIILQKKKTTKSSLTSGKSSDVWPPPGGIAKTLFAIYKTIISFFIKLFVFL